MQSTSCEQAATSAPAPATSTTDDVNAKYRSKYRQLKRYMKDLVFENAALCDHISQVQEKISQRNEERRFMLKKLLDHENELEAQLGRPCSKLNELIASSLPPKRQYKKREKPPVTNGTSSTAAGTSGDGQETREDTQETSGRDDGAVMNGRSEEGSTKADRHAEKNGTHRGVKKRGPANKSDPTSGNKVRKKARDSTPGKRGRNSSVAFDPQSGHPTYPIVVGGFSVQQLGEIVSDRPAYHTESVIYPIGYTATRPYGHYKDPEKRCLYTCRVLDGGDRPRFEIVPECSDPADETGDSKLPKPEQNEEDEEEDEEDGPYVISGSTTDGCHAELLQRINATLNMRSIDSRPSGDWFFGLAHPTIAGLLQSVPGAKRGTTRKDTSDTADRENDPTLSYEALVRHITISAYRTVPEIKEEPPDELFDHSDGNSFSLSV
uniref:INO80 complex subunit E N-terminal domain-containing protein n=1 Tax=Anopheles farauti TaxID=69004 RepID=A0A182QCK6_9DIPT